MGVTEADDVRVVFARGANEVVRREFYLIKMLTAFILKASEDSASVREDFSHVLLRELSNFLREVMFRSKEVNV